MTAKDNYCFDLKQLAFYLYKCLPLILCQLCFSYLNKQQRKYSKHKKTRDNHGFFKIRCPLKNITYSQLQLPA